MSDVETTLDRARRGLADTAVEHELVAVVPVLDKLRRAGLSGAMDSFDAGRIGTAAAAAERLGCDRTAALLARAADIAVSRHGSGLDHAIERFDAGYDIAAVDRELHAAVEAGRLRPPAQPGPADVPATPFRPPVEIATEPAEASVAAELRALSADRPPLSSSSAPDP